MTRIYTNRRCPRKLCEATVETLNKSGMKLARRPWNRFEPTMCPWWAVPSPKQPHHPFGKYYYSWADKEGGSEMLCGYYLEKGLAPAIAQVYPSRKGRNLIMNRNWAWYSFVEGLNDGRFHEAMCKAASHTDAIAEIRIGGGYVQEPSMFDPYNPGYARDEYILTWRLEDDSMSHKAAKRGAMVLKALNKPKSFREFVETINTFDEDHWLWLDVFVAFRFEIKVDGESDSDEHTLSDQQIAESVLLPFSPWVK